MKNQYGEFKPWSPEEDNAIREHSHMGAEWIAKFLGRTRWAVWSRVANLDCGLSHLSKNRESYTARMRSGDLGRFFQYIEYELNTGCWLWSGSQGRGGYGKFSTGNSVSKSAHRWSFETFKGQVPAGLVVCHKCDTPACVNPAH